MEENIQPTVQYTDDNIRHLSDMEHVRTRPGMYIGRLGDGQLPEDGIYVLLKEVIDNSIDEFKMNAGKRIEVDIDDRLRVSVRDYGRGIPQGKLVEAVSVLNTGGKYDSKAFKKSVGLNGVGVKAVNALSAHFEVKSYRDGKVRALKFERGNLTSDITEDSADENGTYIFFEPDPTLFVGYSFHDDFVETMLRNYTYLNSGLTIMYNVVNETFKDLYGYSKLTDRQIEQYVKMYLPMADLDLITIIEDWNTPDHKVVGVGISIPSLARALQKCGGKLFPFGWWHILRALKFHKTEVVDLLLVGVLPEYRQKGANALLFYDLIPHYQRLGFKWGETHVEMETNMKVQGQWQYLNREIHKRRRCYKKDI